MSERKVIIYYRRGSIEVGTGKSGYAWRDGYSANGESGGILFPWMTKRQCQQDAKAQGAKAVFKEPWEK